MIVAADGGVWPVLDRPREPGSRLGARILQLGWGSPGTECGRIANHGSFVDVDIAVVAVGFVVSRAQGQSGHPFSIR